MPEWDIRIKATRQKKEADEPVFFNYRIEGGKGYARAKALTRAITDDTPQDCDTDYVVDDQVETS